MTDTRDDHGRGNALAWFQSIVEMVDALSKVRDDDNPNGFGCEAAERTIQESVLSVEVRSGWHALGETLTPAEYYILLSTGGPAARLIGDLDDHDEPETARLEYQDWGTPWTEVGAYEAAKAGWPNDGDMGADEARECWLTFARQFYFGEG